MTTDEEARDEKISSNPKRIGPAIAVDTSETAEQFHFRNLGICACTISGQINSGNARRIENS